VAVKVVLAAASRFVLMPVAFTVQSPDGVTLVICKAPGPSLTMVTVRVALLPTVTVPKATSPVASCNSTPPTTVPS